jgi:hypothetical protein
MLTELQERLHGTCGVKVSTITIYRALGRRGLSRTRVIFSNTDLAMILLIRQVTRPAIERDEDDRARYQLIIGSHYEPEQMVFVDESAFDRRVSRRPFAWAPIGSRARRRDFFIRGKRYYLHRILGFRFLSLSLIGIQSYRHCPWMGLLL